MNHLLSDFHKDCSLLTLNNNSVKAHDTHDPPPFSVLKVLKKFLLMNKEGASHFNKTLYLIKTKSFKEFLIYYIMRREEDRETGYITLTRWYMLRRAKNNPTQPLL